MFNAYVKQTGDVPVMDQAEGSTQILEYCVVHRIQNSLEITLAVWIQFEDRERFGNNRRL